MAKFHEKLQELNLSEDALSKRIKDNINAYKKLEDAINGVKESIGDTTDDEEKEDLESELVELEESLDEVDNKLVTDIIKFDKNKEHYANLSKNLMKNKGKEKTPKATTQDGASATPTPTPTPTPQANNDNPQPKKKSNWGWVALGLVVLVGTAGAVNMMNKR